MSTRHFSSLQKKAAGFTLVELMIVVAIIGILSAVALPQYNSYRLKAKAKDLLGHARACIMEQLSICVNTDAATIPDAASVGSCGNPPITVVLPGAAAPATISPAYGCAWPSGAGVKATATFGVGADARTFTAECSGTWNGVIMCSLL